MEYNKIIQGDSLEVLKCLPDESVNCCVTSPPYWGYNIIMKTRDKNGRFIKGIHSSQKTEFKEGHHWRKPKPYWSKEWLINEYVNLGKSSGDIAKEYGCYDTNICYFLNKFKIKTRIIAESRKIKYWGLKGKQNGMYGRTGESNPNWNGGNSPERQSLYARSIWKELAKSILKRDNYICQDCGINNKLIVHHIKEWSKYPELRFDNSNLITLCITCHKKRHKGGDAKCLKKSGLIK